MYTRRNDLRFALEISFLLLIFSLGFMQPNIEIGGFPIPASDVIFIVTGGLWLLALILGKIEFRFDKGYLPIGLYLTGLFISSAFSVNPRFSFVKFLGESYLVGLAVLTVNIVTSERLLKKVFLVWIVASVIVTLIGTLTVIFFYLGVSNFITNFSTYHYGSLPPGNYPRLQGTFLFSSLLCNYLTISLLMVFAARKLDWIDPRFFGAVLVIFSVTFAFTVTPGIGGILLAAAMWYWYMSRKGPAYLPRTVLAGGILSALAFLLVSTFTLFTSPTSPYFFSVGGIRIDPSPRLLTWQSSLHTFLEYPVFGKGLGLGVAEVYFMPPSGQIQLLTDAHNTLLNVAGQAGLAGLIPLSALMIYIVYRSRLFRTIVGEISTVRICLGIAFVSAFLYQGLIGSFENSRHLWVLIGLILAVTRSRELDRESTK